MNRTEGQSRRSVLGFGLKAAACCLAGAAAPASAASSANRAAVCLYLLGGNDSNNMIVPTSSSEYDIYARGRGPLAVPKEALLPVDSYSPSAKYGFHPNLPGIQQIYNQGSLAVLANVGRTSMPLDAPGIKANPAALPSDLFLHTGASDVRYVANGYLTLAWATGGDSSVRKAPPVAMLEHGVTMAPRESAPLRDASSPLSTPFPKTPFGRQLESVANRLRISSPTRQLFFCPVGGFDTHGDQLARQGFLFTDLNDAMVAFYGAMRELRIADRVTLFTQSEFDRTLAPNPRGGSEHAWGGHQLIMGGSVLGGRVHGVFPSLELGGPDDLGNNGTWIPSTSNVQYDATIAAWLGRTDLPSLPGFENLREFFPANLGFLAA
jgi:uncharacterized protein (DUF1501 family)